MELVKKAVFENFLIKLENRLKSCGEHMQKQIAIHHDKQLISCTGQHSVVDRVANDIKNFFEINSVFCSYLTDKELSWEDLKYFKLVKLNEIQEFCDQIYEELNVKCPFLVEELRDEEPHDMNASFRIKITANKYYHDKLMQFLNHLLKSKIKVSLKFENELANVFTDSKVMIQIKHLQATQKCAILPIVAHQTFSHNINNKINVVYKSIVDDDLVSDAIVNSTNKELNLANGQVSAIILQKAGHSIQQSLAKNYPNGLNLSKENVAVTLSGKLKNKKFIFHCVMPVWERDTALMKTKFKQIIYSLMIEADMRQLRSIAFPAFGTGALNYPKALVPELMHECVTDYLNEINNQIEAVYFVVYDRDMETVKAFKNYLDLTNNNDMKSISRVDEFHLISDKQENIEKTKHALRNIANSEIKTQEFENNYLSQLDDASKDKIESICKSHVINLKWDNYFNKLMLVGRVSNILICINKITTIITNYALKQHTEAAAELVSQKVKWEYERNDQWVPYNMYENNKIEKEFNKVTKSKLELVDENGVNYLIDLNAKIQYKKDSPHQSNPIRRVDILKEQIAHIKYPDNWMKEKELNLIDLNHRDTEYQHVLEQIYASGFNDTNGLGKVVSIQRIQNKRLFAQYQIHREGFVDKYAANINERILFHGTEEKCVKDIWTKGFNRSYAGKNAVKFGKGVYFATSAWYSAQFADKMTKKHKRGHMFVVRVLTGRSVLGDPDMQMPKNGADTSVNDVINPAMFVIYHDAQAYPDYLFTFE